MNTMIYLKNKKRKNDFFFFLLYRNVNFSHGIRVGFVEKNVVARYRVLTTKEFPTALPGCYSRSARRFPPRTPPKKAN